MKEHHTKYKGDLGVLKVQLDLYEKGYKSYTGTSEHDPFDLIAYKEGGIFKRVQIKYRSVNKNGTIIVDLQTSWTDKRGTHKNPVDKDEIDLFAVYCPETNECYYFNPKDFDETVTLRVEESKNNQTVGVHMASDFKQVL